MKETRVRSLALLLLAVGVFTTTCSANIAPSDEVLRLATTTSTNDSGLLEAILPDFESEFDVRVDVVAVGTGQAIELGKAGDADVILVHSRAREDAFVADGHGTVRYDVMYNDFVIVGTQNDPAGIAGISLAADGFAAIADTQSIFASRGDDSGTHSKELAIWESAGITPDSDSEWYKGLGQGMGATLNYSNEVGAYTLTDRGTFLSQNESLPLLLVLIGGGSIAENEDSALLNSYGVIPVDPGKGNINGELADQFVAWITSVEIQEMIGEYGSEVFGQPLFYPDSAEWRTR